MSSSAMSISGSECTMAVLIVNMGGEMLYILEQRLQAQAIVEEKSLRGWCEEWRKKCNRPAATVTAADNLAHPSIIRSASILSSLPPTVLQDVISTMFSEKFISELFKPQKMYSSTSTRQIFDRLAHSSIMRLNTSSMDKLYDLMTMGCKYQVVSCAHPLDLYQICLNHLDALRILVRNNNDVSKLVENCVGQMEKMFGQMKVGDLHLLRYTLARFFQDRRVKVSLFLTDQLQAQDGSMIHSHQGKMPVGTDRPGTIRYFENGCLKREEFVKLANSDGVIEQRGDIDITKPGRPCELGCNLYAKDRRKKGAAAAAASGATGASSTAAAAGKAKPSSHHGHHASNKSDGSLFEPDEAGKQAAKTELNVLAQMLGHSLPAAGSGKEAEKFSIINLFPDTNLGGGGGAPGEAKADIICFDIEDRDTRAAALSAQFGNLNTSAGGEDEDLLDLMDKNGGDTYDD